MDNQEMTPQQVNFIEDFSRRIESALEELLGRYKNLNEDYSSAEALKELTYLDEQVTQITQKISELCTVDIDIKSLDRDQEKLLELQSQLKFIISGVKDLKQNVDILQALSNDILPDFQQEDFLEVTRISSRIRENEKTWSVTVRSKESNKGYFRNVDIVSVGEHGESNVLANIKLVQPGTEVKVPLKYVGEDYPRVQAFLNGAAVSNVFQGFPVEIQAVSISEDDSLILRVQNTSDEKLEKNYIFLGNDLISQDFVLNKRQTKLVPINLMVNSSYLKCGNYDKNKFISNQFLCDIKFIVFHQFTQDQREQFLKYVQSDSINDILAARRLVLNLDNPHPN